MRKVGVIDYESFAKAVLKEVKSKPISFEVLSDDFAEMRRQALKIHEWQDNVYVKIPITNTSGESSVPLIEALAAEGVKAKYNGDANAAPGNSRHCRAEPQRPIDPVSVRWTNRRYRGRPIADNEGIARDRTSLPNAELLWASVRGVLNVFQAAACGCHIVTVPHDILKKLLELGGKDLDELSLDTVRMFHGDAVAAGFKL